MRNRQLHKTIMTFFLIISFGLLNSSAQNIVKLRHITYQSNYNFDIVKDFIQPIPSLEPNAKVSIKILKKIEIVNNELIINYTLPKLKTNQKFVVSIKAFFDTEDITPDSSQLIGDIGTFTTVVSSKNQIIWKDLISSIPKGKGILTLQIDVERWGTMALSLGVDCDNPPQYQFKKKWPYYATAAVGVGTLLVGEIYFKKSQNHFSTHESTNSILEYDSSYEEYKKDLKISRGFALTGAAIMVVELYWLGRRRLVNRRMKIFDENCNYDSFSIRPNVTFPTYAQAGSIGVNVKYQF